jgi:TolC family type I secretion outer membrane protein
MKPMMLGLMLAGVAPVAAGEALAESLAEALASAYLDSPRLEGARAGLRAADEALPIAKAAGRPQLLGTTSAAFNAMGDTQPAGRQALSLSQSLYSGGGIAAATRQARRAVEAERARLMLSEQGVLLDVVAAYTAVVRDRRVLELARGNEDRLGLELAATRDRERFGDLTETDIHQAESRHEGGIADRIAAEGALAASEAEYARVVGRQPGELEPAPLPEFAPATLEAAMAEAEGNWAWQAASSDVAAAEEAVAVSLAALKPRLTLAGEIGYALDGGTQYNSGPGAVVGTTLVLPLYQGGGDHARVRQSKEQLSQRRYGRDDARRGAEAAIVDAWRSGRTADAAIRAIRRQVSAARFTAEGVRAEARVGARSVVDVLDAERDLFAAEVDLAHADREQTLAAYRLQAAVGRLTGQDLALPVAYHDPEEHYRDSSGRWFGLEPSEPDD